MHSTPCKLDPQLAAAGTASPAGTAGQIPTGAQLIAHMCDLRPVHDTHPSHLRRLHSQASHTLPPSQPAVSDQPALRAEVEEAVVNMQASHTLPALQPAVIDKPGVRAGTEEPVVSSQASHNQAPLQQSPGKRHASRLEPQPQAPLQSAVRPTDPQVTVSHTHAPLQPSVTNQHALGLHIHAPLQPPVNSTDQHAPGLHTHTLEEPRAPRRLLLILALRDPAWLSAFLAQQTEPWEVHIWQAALASDKSTAKQAGDASAEPANASLNKSHSDPEQPSAHIATEEGHDGSLGHFVHAVRQAKALSGKAEGVQIVLHEHAAGMSESQQSKILGTAFRFWHHVSLCECAYVV